MTLVKDIIDVIYTSMSHLSQPHYFEMIIIQVSHLCSSIKTSKNSIFEQYEKRP